LRKDPRFIKVEHSEGFLNAIVEQKHSWLTVWQQHLIYAKPVLIRPDGTERVELLTLTKEEALDHFNNLKKVYKQAKLIKVTRNKASTFSFFSQEHILTTKQQTALRLAKQNGYYDYPRKIKIENLAEKMGIAFSTFQEHLRKAESKILLQT